MMKIREKMKLERIINKLKYGSIGVGKKMIGPSISLVMGYGFGKLGKAINHEEIMAVPLAMDLSPFGGGMHPIPCLFYGAGIAMNYLPEIYQFLQNC